MPEEFHLCQPAPVLFSAPSCAACCGVYNYEGHSRELVTSVLRLQTGAMEGWDGTDAEVERIREKVLSSRPPIRFEVIYNCPFSGFLDKAETRVGCLLHPLRLGRDLRDYCQYGHRTCGEAKCTSYTYLGEKESRAVMAACGDWYLYGLCIQDIDLIKGFVELAADRLHATPDLGMVARDEKAARVFHRYLKLKEEWPFARDPGRFGKYYFQGRSYQVYMIDYDALGSSAPRHDLVLRSLGSTFQNKDELMEAVSILDERIDAFVELLD